MQPQQQYDFIMDPSQKQTGGPAFLQNPKQKNLVLVVFGLVVIMLIIIIGSFIFSSGGGSNDDLVSMTAYQTEIERVSELGLKSSTDLSTRNKLITLQSFINTDRNSTVTYLDKNGIKVTKEQQATQRDSTIDTSLDTALQTNRFDEELLEQIDSLMNSYAKALGSSLASPEGPNKKILLDNAALNVTTYYGN